MPRFLVAKRLSICTKEPIHYVTYGSGMQTWDACPQLSARFTEGSSNDAQQLSQKTEPCNALHLKAELA